MNKIVEVVGALIGVSIVICLGGILVSIGYNAIARGFNLPEFSWWAFACLGVGLRFIIQTKVDLKVKGE